MEKLEETEVKLRILIKSAIGLLALMVLYFIFPFFQVKARFLTDRNLMQIILMEFVGWIFVVRVHIQIG